MDIAMSSASFRPHRAALAMRPSATVRVVWSVCRSVTIVRPVKAAEPIAMQFGILTRVDPRNHVLDGGGDAPTERGTFGVSG